MSQTARFSPLSTFLTTTTVVTHGYDQGGAFTPIRSLPKDSAARLPPASNRVGLPACSPRERSLG